MPHYVKTGDQIRDRMITALLSRSPASGRTGVAVFNINSSNCFDHKDLPHGADKADALILICDKNFFDSSKPSEAIETDSTSDAELAGTADDISERLGKPVFLLREPFSFYDFFDVISRISHEPADEIADDIPEYDHETRTVTKGELSASLTAREAELFELLLEKNGIEVSRQTIYDRLWKNEKDTNVADVYVSYLRKKLNRVLGNGFLISMRGKGYILKFK